MSNQTSLRIEGGKSHMEEILTTEGGKVIQKRLIPITFLEIRYIPDGEFSKLAITDGTEEWVSSDNPEDGEMYDLTVNGIRRTPESAYNNLVALLSINA